MGIRSYEWEMAGPQDNDFPTLFLKNGATAISPPPVGLRTVFAVNGISESGMSPKRKRIFRRMGINPPFNDIRILRSCLR